MTSSLFRPEALEHRKDRLYGEVILLNPLSMRILVGAVVIISFLILVILFWGTYARKESVQGYLIPDKGIVKTYTYQPGNIAKVYIKEGDEVTQGQPLVTIVTERAVQGGSDIESMQLQELEATQKQYLASIQAQKDLALSETANYQNQIQSYKNELVQIEQNLKNQAERVHLVEERVAGVKKLYEKNHISEHDYQKLAEDLLMQKNQYQDLLRTKGNVQSSLSQTQSKLQQLPINTQTHISEFENRISELKQKYAETKGHRTFEIRSPVDGVVTALQAKVGQWQLTNAPLMAIIPKDAQLQAELYLPSRAIGFIEKGQVVRLRYAPFPYQRFGIYEGTVSEISKYALLPQELSVPTDSKEPVYRITVKLKDQNVRAYGKNIPLQPGMAVEASIILEKRTLFEWILDPVLSLKGRF
jgi:membrane fusion protein